MNIGINKKLITILFIGFLSTFAGEIKAEEICYFSNAKEFQDCSNSNTSIIPKYPFVIGDFNYLWRVCPNSDYLCLKIKKKASAIRLSSDDGLNLIITNGNPGRLSILPMRHKNSIKVPKQNIVKWTKRRESDIASGGLMQKNFYNITYLDNWYSFSEVNFFIWSYRTFDDNVVRDLIIDISQLKDGEVRDLNPNLEELLKELQIIGNILKVDSISNKDCLFVKDMKFPELTLKYKSLYSSIKPLRAKLDLPPSTDLKPICK